MDVNLYVILFISIISSCVGLECYECRMDELDIGDPKCKDPFYELEPPYLKVCDDDIYKKCRKTVTYLANNKMRLVRECAESCPNEGCKNYGGGQRVCEVCCAGDGCNGAVSMTFDMAVFASVMAAGLVLAWQ